MIDADAPPPLWSLSQFHAGRYGATGDGTTDDSPAIQAAIDAASTAGGGAVYIPEGTYRLLVALDSKRRVSIVGEGMGRTILKPEGDGVHAITGSATSENPLVDITYQDFQIDCTGQTGLAKGIFAVYMQRCRFVRIWCHDSGATGLGVDYLADVSFISCIAERAGRNGTTSDPGCSGFGLGTGQWGVENVTLYDCIGRENKRYGVFFERLTGAPTYSRGAQIVGGHFSENYRGIGDNGSRDLIVNGAHVYDNIDDGIYVGADQSSHAGYDGLITNCHVSNNGGNGILIDYTVGTQHGRYTVRGNVVESNVSCGIRVSASGSLPGITINDNRVERNGRSGILLNGGTFLDPEVCRNKVNANGQTDTGGVDHGIHTIANLTRPLITQNHCHDDGAVKQQQYGILLGANSNFTVTDGWVTQNFCAANGTGAYSASATVTGTVVSGNPPTT